jgi:hypothetical protein
VERCKAVRPETAGFREIVALRLPSGPVPGRISDALPGRGAAASLGGAFVGRDGRLYVWDADFRNVKIVSSPPGGRATLAVTPFWSEAPDSALITGGAEGRFEPLEGLQVVDAPELSRPRPDAFARRLVHDDPAAIVLADSAGRALASMAVPRRLAWKHVAIDGDLLEPGGSLLSLHSTIRALVVYRLTPEIEDVPALPGRLYGPPYRPQLPR